MKDKGLAIAAIAAVAVIIIGVVILAKPKATKPAAGAPGAAAVAAKPGKIVPVVPPKKVFSKDMGGLTVKLLGAKDKELAVGMRVFRALDSKSSVLMGTATTNRMQEFAPGTYDIELETAPIRLYKGINIQAGRETVENLGRLTGTLVVKGATSKKGPASYPVRVLHPRSGIVVAAGAAGRPMEIVSGVYDIDVASLPRQVRKDVRIEAGKDAEVDIGSSGALLVKVVDESGKEMRGAVKIRDARTKAVVTALAANRPVDILAGVYSVESSSVPPQAKGDVTVKAGEETVVEFVVPAPPAPAPKPAAPAKPVVPAKKPGA